jgi:Fe-S oxidoreductase
MKSKLPLASQQQKALENCAFCPKLCRAVCPVSAADRRETLTPWGKMSLTWMAARGQVEISAEVAEVAWACTGCMACRDNCDHENPVAETLAMARGDYFALGLAPEAAKKTAEAFEQRAERLSTATHALGQSDCVDERSKIALLVGCSYTTNAPEVAASIVRVAAAFVGPVRLVDACCGLPLLLAGDQPGLQRAQEKLTSALIGTSRIVVADPGCTRMLQSRSAESLVALVARGAEKIPQLSREASGAPLRYHDPCQLGRGLGLYEEPRAILQQLLGEPVQEFARNRRDGVCSGGGGLLPETAPSTSERIAKQRLDDHRALGGGTVVTACGQSLRRFQESGAGAIDLFTLVDRALTS